MGVQFSPHDGMPILFGTVLRSEEPMPHERRGPSGWWILPAIIFGFIESIAIVGWLVS